jgi:hypothetical protein
VQLPLVLDDVLVNFDTGRARAAAEVLCDFAAKGHQLLIFTCHEHVWQMFKDLGADVRTLPENSRTNMLVVPAEAGRRLPRFAPEPAPIVETVPDLELEPIGVAELPPPVLQPEPREFEPPPSEWRVPTWEDDEALLDEPEEPTDIEIPVADLPPLEPAAFVPPPPPPPPPPPHEPAPSRRRKRVVGARGWEVELEEELKQLQKKDSDAA